MKDFGRKDFGDALSRFFGEAKSQKQLNQEDPDASEFGDFAATKKAQVASDGELDSMEGDLGTMLDAFQSRWDGVRTTLRTEVRNALKAVQAFADQNPGLVKSTGPTSMDDAERAALGGTKDQIRDKFSRVDAAGGRDRTTTSAGNVSKLSGQDIDQGLPGDVTPTPGAADDAAAAAIQGPRAERERRTNRRAAGRNPATGGV